MNRHLPFTALILTTLAALACNLGQPAAPTAPATAPAAAPTLPPTAAPLATSAPPTVAAAPTAPAAPPALPEGPLSTTGPWVLIEALDDEGATGGLWAVNPDGSGLTQIAEGKIFSFAVSPSGGRIAYVVAATRYPAQESALMIYTFSTGQTQTVTALTTAATGPDSLAWSADGRRLAFVGAQDGPTGDLYVYSLDGGQITRLSDGPSQAIYPTWSPDGQYIVHAGTEATAETICCPFSRSDTWVVRPDGSDLQRLENVPSGVNHVYGWRDARNLLFAGQSFDCSGLNLREVNVETGEMRELVAGGYNGLAFDPAGGSALVVQAGCLPDQPMGIFLIPAGATDAAPVAETSASPNAPVLALWSPEAGIYLAGTGTGLVTVTPQGQASPVIGGPGNPLAAAIGGQVWAWQPSGSSAGLAVGGLSETPRPIFNDALGQVVWSPGIPNLFFTADDLYVARSPDFTPVAIPGISRPYSLQGVPQ